MSSSDTLLARPWLDHYGEDIPHAVEEDHRSLFALLDTAAAQYPGRMAVIFQNTRITYRELHDRAERFAAALRSLGVMPGARVGLMLPNLPQTIIAFWGILKAGGIVVMLNPLYMETELVHHLNDAGAEYLITLDLLWPRFAALRDRLPLRQYIITTIADALSFPLNWFYRLKNARSPHAPAIPYAKEGIHAWKRLVGTTRRFSMPVEDACHRIAMIQYTGGTTGLPKGVMLTHANLATNARQIISVLNEGPHHEHRFVALMPFFHVYGLAVGITIPAAIAATTLPLPRYVPQDVLKLIQKHRPTIFPGAPSVYISLMQQKNLADCPLDCIQICVSGSAPLSEEHFRRFQAITNATIVEGFGLTEASPITHINPIQPSGQKIGSIGMPLPNTEARIVDMEDGTRILPPGQLGELLVRGPQVMRGYWKREEETAAVLRDGWLHTGDLAVMDEDGYFRIMDRKKDMVIVAGYNVYPREVDEVLLAHPDILEAVAVGITDPARGEILKCYVVVKEGRKLTRADIIGWCRARLAAYKVPRQVEFRDSLPKTIVGKVLRRALREEEEQRNG